MSAWDEIHRRVRATGGRRFLTLGVTTHNRDLMYRVEAIAGDHEKQVVGDVTGLADREPIRSQRWRHPVGR